MTLLSKEEYIGRKCEIRPSEYAGVHHWVKYHYGKAGKCEMCSGEKAKRFEWALKKGCRYEKNVNNFMQLCPSCHRKYDDAGKKKTWTPDSFIKVIKGRNKAVVQLTMTGEVIKKWESIKIASETLCIGYVGILNCAKGRTKYSAKYKWKYA